MNATATAAATAGTANGTAVLPLVGRILIASLFLVAGVRKALAWGGTAGYFAKLGFPAPELMVALAILIEVGAAAMLIIGWRTRIAAWILAAFVVIATFMAHRFWAVDPAQYVNQLNHFLKNGAILGALLFIATYGPGRMSVDKM
jgi:putative oxidoreductase